MMDATLLGWIGFTVLIIVLVYIDLHLFARAGKVPSLKESAIWSVGWVIVALLFNLGVLLLEGREKGVSFFTGYLIERALAIDNVFVFVMIFAAFAVAPKLQGRALTWGIIGALVLRAGLILAGSALVHQFHWVLMAFGAFLIVTAARMLFQGEEQMDMESSRLVRVVRRVLPVTSDYHGERLFIRDQKEQGKWLATPLLLVLIVIAFSDLIFALDSIPAIFSITQDTFIVLTSNVFAVLGLRAMYFLLAGVIDRFYLLKPALAAILAFVGIKMLIENFYAISIGLSLLVIVLLLAIGIGGSLLFPKEEKPHEGEATNLEREHEMGEG